MPRLSPHPITLLLLGALILMLCILPSASGAPTPHGSLARAPSSPDPLTCRGYPEERLFLESQIWWKRANGKSGTDFGHVHTGMCFPYLQTLSGKFVVHVVTKLHDNPGTFNDIIFQARNEAYSSRPLQLRPHIVVRKKCPLADCTFVTRAVIDTRVLPVDGLWQFRIRSRVTEPDRRVAMPSNAFPVYVQNGRPRRDGPAWTQGRGWYGRPLGYNDAYFMGIIPESPVAGVWEPSVRTNRVNKAEKSKMTPDPRDNRPRFPRRSCVPRSGGPGGQRRVRRQSLDRHPATSERPAPARDHRFVVEHRRPRLNSQWCARHPIRGVELARYRTSSP